MTCLEGNHCKIPIKLLQEAQDNFPNNFVRLACHIANYIYLEVCVAMQSIVLAMCDPLRPLRAV